MESTNNIFDVKCTPSADNTFILTVAGRDLAILSEVEAAYVSVWTASFRAGYCLGCAPPIGQA